MLKVICLILILCGAGVMLVSIYMYRGTLKTYKSYLTPVKNPLINRHTSILVMMLFFLMGYIATFIYIAGLDTVDMSLFLISIIFFFGAVFCWSVVFVQSMLLGRLEHSAEELRKAFAQSQMTNKNLEAANTDLTATMEELKNAQSQLILSEKMSALGELMARVSHEINTPICAIRASAENLTQSFADSFEELFTEIRKLSDSDFDEYVHFTKTASANEKKYTSTSEVRALKRKAKQVLSEQSGYNDEILDLLARSLLLDNETIEYVAQHMNTPTFTAILRLSNKTVTIINSIGGILYSANKVIKMVSALKSFSHHDTAGEKKPFSVVDGIETVLAIYVNQLKYDVEVVTDFDDVPEIMGYGDELSQVWSNIIQNALYAMNNRNTVGEQQPCKLTIDVKKKDENNIVVRIADNGSGISTDTIEKIFEPFYTTKPTGIGTGLGLNISKKIIDKHDGTIQVESKPNCGTTFIITLPISATTQE